MATDRILLRDVIGSFAPGQGLRAVLLLTYSFDGRWLEEGFIPDLFDRPVGSAVVVRDGNAVIGEAPTVRYHRANAAYSSRIFHPKLGLFIAEDRALAVIGSANLTRGGLERNLELASVHEVSAAGGPRNLFQGILEYVSGPLLQEVRGTSAAAVLDAAVALREVLDGVPEEDSPQHLFLHNYQRALWGQVLDALPHRHVSRLSIVSPFFEPNGGDREDPQQQDETGLFARLFEDLRFEAPRGEKPVAVFFQQSEGRTALPVDKLEAWRDRVALHQRLSTTADEPRPLHAKLLVIEGAKGEGREPFLIALHGSPNFTSAAYLGRPPQGNAEIAVLTRMPPRRNGSNRIWSVLNLGHLFGEVEDWGTLVSVVPERDPLPPLDAFRLDDAGLRLSERKIDLCWQGSVPAAAALRLLVEANGGWSVLAEAPMEAGNRLCVDVPGIAEKDAAEVLQLKASRVKVELIDASGAVVASGFAALNVDCPQQFCGLAMVGQMMATLDQRIALAGCGVPQTYRDQQRFLEQLRGRVLSNPGKPLHVLTHQADLDRFFRNLHSGLRGVRAMSESLPNSEYTFRRTIKDLGRWCREALSEESMIPSDECRLFLVDRLGRELQRTLERAVSNKVLRARVGEVARELQVASALRQAAAWVDLVRGTQLGGYAQETCRRLASVASLLKELEGS